MQMVRPRTKDALGRSGDGVSALWLALADCSGDRHQNHAQDEDRQPGGEHQHRRPRSFVPLARNRTGKSAPRQALIPVMMATPRAMPRNSAPRP